MSGPMAAANSNCQSPSQGPALCDCKAVSLRFRCGHVFMRMQSCNEETGLCVGDVDPTRRVILESREECAECMMVGASEQGQYDAHFAAGKLSETFHLDGHHDDFRKSVKAGRLSEHTARNNVHDDATQTLATTTELELHCARWPLRIPALCGPASSVYSTDECILPALKYDLHAPGNASNDRYPHEKHASQRHERIANWVEGDNEFFEVEPPTGSLLFDWLASEMTKASDEFDMQEEGQDPNTPDTPSEAIDDPWDTSASSCGRLSDGTLRQYNPGTGNPPTGTKRTRQDIPDNMITRTGLIKTSIAVRPLHTKHSLSFNRFFPPVIQITKPGPPEHMFSRISTSKMTLTQKAQTFIHETCDVISERVFMKRGFDGRLLQRRGAAVLQRRMTFSRRGSRVERKAGMSRIRTIV